MTAFHREFRNLLYAAFNVSSDIEPGDADGDIANDLLLSLAKTFSEIADRNDTSRNALRTACLLFVEVTAAPDPIEYMKAECEKGQDGARHEFDGAGIEVTVKTPYE